MFLGHYYLLVYILLCFQLNHAPIILVYNAKLPHYRKRLERCGYAHCAIIGFANIVGGNVNVVCLMWLVNVVGGTPTTARRATATNKSKVGYPLGIADFFIHTYPPQKNFTTFILAMQIPFCNFATYLSQ